MALLMNLRSTEYDKAAFTEQMGYKNPQNQVREVLKITQEQYQKFCDADSDNYAPQKRKTPKVEPESEPDEASGSSKRRKSRGKKVKQEPPFPSKDHKPSYFDDKYGNDGGGSGGGGGGFGGGGISGAQATDDDIFV